MDFLMGGRNNGMGTRRIGGSFLAGLSIVTSSVAKVLKAPRVVSFTDTLMSRSDAL
jgi:hypothetical protein